MTAPAHDVEAGQLPERLGPLAGVVVLGAVMTVLDATAVNVALASLARDLRAPLAAVQWVLTGYLLTLALVVPLSGWATDRFGPTRLWMASLVLFLVGSVLCGVSWSIGSLIVFRLVQGLGGGMISPIAQTILARAAGPRRMGRAMSSLGVVSVLGPVIGPVVGGLLVQAASWRLIFFVNLPIGALALIGAARILPRLEGRRSERLDTLGLALASVGLVALTFGLSEAGSENGAGAPESWGPIVAGLVLLTLFALHSRRSGAAALVDVRLFTNRGFAVASVALFLIGMALFGTLLLLPLYYQAMRGLGPLEAGLLMVPQGAGVAAALPLAGRLTDRRGARAAVLPGIALMLTGTAVFTQVTARSPYALLSVALLVRGLGMGLVMTPVTAAAYVQLPRRALARASSATTAIRQTGGAVGTALLAVLLARSTFAHAFWGALALTGLVLPPALLLPSRSAQDDRCGSGEG